MMHSGWGKDGGNLHIELNEHGQIIGPEGTRLSSKLGVLARNGVLAPLNHKDWRLVPSMYKDRIWAQIKVLSISKTYILTCFYFYIF